MVEPAVFAVIVAAGSGTRFGSGMPKQFLELAGKPVLRHSIDTFARAMSGCRTVLVLSDTGEEIWRDYCRRAAYTSPLVVPGGATRSESVLRGLDVCEAIAENEGIRDPIVLVHDGARPLVTEDMILALVEALCRGCRAATPALPVTDSLMIAMCNEGVMSADRANFRSVQTPQAFRLADIIAAHRLCLKNEVTTTDECSAFTAATGLKVQLIPGSPDNIKITNPRDLAVAELIYSSNHS